MTVVSLFEHEAGVAALSAVICGVLVALSPAVSADPQRRAVARARSGVERVTQAWLESVAQGRHDTARALSAGAAARALEGGPPLAPPPHGSPTIETVFVLSERQRQVQATVLVRAGEGGVERRGVLVQTRRLGGGWLVTEALWDAQ